MVAQSTTIASIANGHAFQKHVVDNGEFQNVNVKTPEDLARHIQDTINSPDTVGAATYDNNARVKEIYLANPKTNTLIVMSPTLAHGDAGTVYKTDTNVITEPLPACAGRFV